jgi:hypothetical protein
MKKFFEYMEGRWTYLSVPIVLFFVINMRSCNWYKKLIEPKKKIEFVIEERKAKFYLDVLGIEPSNTRYSITESVYNNDSLIRSFLRISLKDSLFIKNPKILDTLNKRYFIRYNSISDSVKKDDFTLDVLMRAKYLLDSNDYQIFVKKIKTNIRI